MNKTTMKKRILHLGMLTSALMFLGVGINMGDTIPTIILPTKKVRVDLVQKKISVARYVGVSTATFNQTVFNGWLTAGSAVLQVKNSASDYACPVKLVADGAIGTFTDQEPMDFFIINTQSEYEALRLFVSGHRVKVVNFLTWCGGNGDFAGCSDFPGNHIVIAGEAPLTQEILVHEFGHNQNLPDVGVPTRIMYGVEVSGRNELTQFERDKFKQ